MEKKSKEHEVNVLSSVFNNSKRVFEDLGYIGYSFDSRDGDGVPDGFFTNGSSTIWIEHTQARLNYGKKGSVLPGYDGFCNDIQRELLKEANKGCVCFDIPSSLADLYFSHSDFRSEVLDIVRKVIESSAEFVDDERKMYVKYCSPETCCLKNLIDYKGLRVTVSRWHNIEFCHIIPRTIYDECLSIKEQKYRANISPRDENWLFIEVPWGYSFRLNDLPKHSSYFDKIFIVENFIDCFIPRLSAWKR